MPAQTWWNLPEAKRRLITEVAMREFGSRGFSAGSLNVIAREAGIAKGSLFQYFSDKLDMFATVCDSGSTEIETQVLSGIDEDLPFFDILRALVARWITYFRTNPFEQALAFAAANEIDQGARIAVRGVTNEHYAKALRPMVDRAIARGELASDADPDLVVSSVAMVLRHLNSAPFDSVGDPVIPFTDLPDDEVGRWADAYVDMLERGFGPRS